MTRPHAWDRALGRLEDALLLISCGCLLAIVGITTADVVARSFFNAPFAWSHDLITQYLLVAMFFLSLPYVTRIGGHMSLDLLASKLRHPVGRTLLVLFGELLALLFVLGFVYGAWSTVTEAYVGGDRLQGDLPWPTWPSRALGPLGAAVLALRLLMRIGQAMAALRARVHPPYLGIDGH